MVTSSNEWKILELDEKLQTNKAIVLSFFRRNIDSQSVYAVLSKSLVSLGIDNTRGNPGIQDSFGLYGSAPIYLKFYLLHV